MHPPTAFACALAALLLAACASKQSAPVIERSPGAAPPAISAAPAAVPAAPAGPEFYTIKRGDTLYSIALDNGQDYRDIATWNNLDNPNVIQVGQVLRVRPAAGTAAAAAGDSPGVVVHPILPPGVEPAGVAAGAAPGTPKIEPNGAKRPYSEEALAQAQKEAREPVRTVVAVAPAGAPPAAVTSPAAPAAKPAEADIVWSWPSSGKMISPYAEGANKGVDLAAKVGEPVLAAAPGKVIYSDQSLRGYGKLIIIKHSNDFLSAYAHNSALLVKEGQTVAKGQKIAEAGSTDSDTPKVHFEIRLHGKPVDPAKYLPAR